MAVWTTIEKEELKGLLRIDAEYYQPLYFNILDAFRRLSATPLEKVVKSARRRFTPESEKYFKYIEISEVDTVVGTINAKKIIGKEAPDRAQFIVKKGDVIISTVRPNRNAVALITDDEDNFVCSSGFAVLKPEKLSPEFLFAYLKINPIVKLLTRQTTATMYPAVSLKDILALPVFRPDKSIEVFVKEKVKKAQQELKESKKLYQQAEQKLLEELGIKDWELSHQLTYTMELKEVLAVDRFDAEYFQPKYEKLLKVVSSKFKIKDLKELFSFKRGIFIPTDCYTEEKTPSPYIRIKELTEKGGLNKSEIVFIDESYSGKNIDKLKKDDLVIAIIGDTIGKTNKIDEDLAGGYCSNNTGRLRIKSEWKDKIIPEFNEILFQSVFIQSQVEQKKAQTAQPKINNSELNTMKIPVLPKSTQIKIAELVRQSHESHKKARRLLDEVKNRIEQLIKVEK